VGTCISGRVGVWCGVPVGKRTGRRHADHRRQRGGVAADRRRLERHEELAGQEVGVLHDIIIAPDNAASFAIVAAHQFLGVSQHDVAIPMSQLDFVNGKLVWAGATRDAVKSIPAFQYTKVRTVPVARQDYGKH
jgi:hypothetical protein